MQIDRTARDAVVAVLNERVSKLKDTIAVQRPQDTEKDNAITWWNRGQIFALTELTKLLTEEDNE